MTFWELVKWVFYSSALPYGSQYNRIYLTKLNLNGCSNGITNYQLP